MVRAFGVTYDAGVGVREESAQGSIEQSQYGWLSLVGQAERGTVNRADRPALNLCTTAEIAKAKLGGRMDGIVSPDAFQDYFDLGSGAGGLVFVRVTDGHEVEAYVDLFSRGTGLDYNAALADKDNQSQVKIPMLRFAARNGGRWAGRRQAATQTLASAASLDETVLTADGDPNWGTNQWVGAVLVVVGVEEGTVRTYTVLSNTDNAIHVRADQTMKTDVLGSTTVSWHMDLDNPTLANGSRKGMAIKVVDAKDDPASNFGIEVYLDGSMVRPYPTLSMDPTSQYYAPTKINDDKGNNYVTVTDLYISTGGSYVADMRPANWYGRLTDLQAGKITINPVQVRSVGDSKILVLHAYIDDDDTGVFATPLKSLVPAPEPRTYTLTWNATSHKYGVVVSALRDGGFTLLETMADIAVGAAAQLAKTLDLGNGVKVLVDHSAEPADGSEVVIDLLPLPWWNIAGGYVIPNVKGSPNRKYRIKDASESYAEIEAGDMTAAGVESSLPAVTGSVAGPFAITSANKAFKLALDGLAAVTGNLTEGPACTAAQVASDINGLFTSTYGAGVLAPAAASTDGKRVVISGLGIKGQGGASSVEIETATGSAYATLGFTVGITYGVDGIEPTVAGWTGTKAGPFTVITAVNDALKFVVDGRKVVSVAIPGAVAPGVPKTAAQVVAAINAAFDVVFGAGNLNPASVVPVGADTYVRMQSSGFDGGGPCSTVDCQSVAADAYQLLGFVEGAIVKGRLGAECMFQYGDEPGNGYDGGTPTDQDYLDAFAVGSSPLNKLLGRGYGMIMLGAPDAPGIVVQKAAQAYAEAANHMLLPLFPIEITDDQDAVDHLNNVLGRSNYQRLYFPSYVSVPDPDRGGAVNKVIPAIGMAAGRIALWAKTNGGYHIPAAGEDCTLPRVVKLSTAVLPDDDGAVNGEILTPAGINSIRIKKGNYVLWGGRTGYRDNQWKYATERMQVSHYEHTFLANMEWVVFMLNNAGTRKQVIGAFLAYFTPELAKGAIVGSNVLEATLIKVDDENNPATEIEEGNLHAGMSLRMGKFVERFIISIGKQGVFEG